MQDEETDRRDAMGTFSVDMVVAVDGEMSLLEPSSCVVNHRPLLNILHPDTKHDHTGKSHVCYHTALLTFPDVVKDAEEHLHSSARNTHHV